MIIIENKNTFEDLLGLEIETEDKFLNKKLNSHVCYSGGGGGGSKQQDIAPTLQPYVRDVLGRAKGMVDTPYQAYPGERIVGFTPQELAAQAGIQQMAGQYGLASMAPGLTSSAAYYAPAYGYLGQTGQALGVGAGALSESGDIQRAAAREIGRDEIGRFALTGEDIQKYMDPYQQAVIDIEKQQARQDALQTAQAIAAKSAGMGGFGGSRQAILEAQAASDLGKRLSDIQTRGSQAAYQQALQTAAQQQQVGLGEAAAQRAREQQLGAGIAGLAGQYGQLAGGLGALSGQYGSLGQQALGQGYRELGYLSGVGEAQRGLGQERADVAYQDFREAREYPMQQLERYAGMAFGVPSGYIQGMQAQPSGFQQAVGGLATAAGLGRGLNFFKEGGNIGKGGLSTVYRNTAGKVTTPTLGSFNIEDLKKYLIETRFDTKKREEELARQKRQAEANALIQAGAAITKADTSLNPFGLLTEGAAGALPALQERLAIQEQISNIPMEEREATVKDFLTLKELEEMEADIKKTQAEAEAEGMGLLEPAELNALRKSVATKLGYVFDEVTNTIKNFDGSAITPDQAAEESQLLTQAAQAAVTGGLLAGQKVISDYTR